MINLCLTKFYSVNQMPSATQEKKQPLPIEPALNPREVKVALAIMGWTQARLAQEVGKSLTTINLAINHNTFPEVTKVIRRKLAL